MSWALLRRFFMNPVMVVVPVVLVLLLAWQYYAQTQRHLDQPDHNILPNASFETTRHGHLPQGWAIEATPDSQYDVSPIKGYVSGKGLNITNKNQSTLLFSSPKVPIKKDTTYFFKSFYLAQVNFDLLMRVQYADGTSRLQFLEHYQPTSDPWSTLSYGFKADDQAVSVQFLYKLLGNGALLLDDNYLKEDAAISTTQIAQPRTNAIPNGNFDTGDIQTPQDWITYATGENRPQFSYITEGANKFVRVQVQDYKNGEAKWQYAAQPAKAGQHFSVELDYKSDAPSELVVESVLQNGQHYFEVLDQLSPATDWTHYQAQFETPTNAQTTFVSVALQHTGTLDTDSYALHTNASEAAQFASPTISLTFDDGWGSQIKKGVPALDGFNFKGTFYINPATIDTRQFASLQAVQALATQGHEIAAHGQEHKDMTTLAATALQRQLKLSRQFLQVQFGQKHSNFASPYGKSDAQMQPVLQAIYRSHRGTKSGINTKQNFNPYDLRVFFVSRQTTAEQITKAIDKAKAFNGWLIFVYHHIDDQGGQNSISTAAFQEQLQLIKQSQLPVKTIDKTLDELSPNK